MISLGYSPDLLFLDYLPVLSVQGGDPMHHMGLWNEVDHKDCRFHSVLLEKRSSHLKIFNVGYSASSDLLSACSSTCWIVETGVTLTVSRIYLGSELASPMLSSGIITSVILASNAA